MATVQEILAQFKLVGSDAGVTRTEVVPGSTPAHISDAGKAILAWDKQEFLGNEPPAQVLEQTQAVREMLPVPGSPWKVPEPMQADIAFMKTVDAKKNVYFLDHAERAPEIEPDCKAAHDAWQAETDDKKKTAARIKYMTNMAFKHLLNGREGPSSAINTYDNAIFTWGMGWGANGGLPKVMSAIHRIEKEANPDDLEKHYVQKLFYLCGFKFDGRYWVVDTEKKKVYANDHAVATDADSAFRYIHDTLYFHYMWALVSRDPMTKKTILDAQREVFAKGTGSISRSEKIQTAALYTFIAHLQHWTGDTTMDYVSWALGPKANPKVTETMPSEKADAQIAVNVVHRHYHVRNPDHGATNNNFDDHVRDYWKQMVGVDTTDESLTDFKPDYPNMSAAPVDSAAIPIDHLGAKTAGGKSYDLGPLVDFDRAPPSNIPYGPPAPPAAETTDPPPDQPTPPPAPPPGPPPSTYVEPPSWYHCFARGTPIVCPEGTRLIEELREGDEIVTFDDTIGAVSKSRVARRAEHPATPCLVVQVEGCTPLRVTANHPILVEKEWRRAGSLRVGETLWVLDADKTVPRPITAIQVPAHSDSAVYDLHVETHFTYFAGGVLVHNKLM